MWSVYINASETEGIETAHYLGRMVRAVTESQAFGYPPQGTNFRTALSRKNCLQKTPRGSPQGHGGMAGCLVAILESGADERD